MRNLKRVLSLALASVMVLGMMVMGAGAADTKSADLTDMDKVTNKEAVTLLVDLKVITGKPDGSYAPTEVVDRATMSTLIYKIMTGETSADAYKGTGTLKDVAGTWAEGFINYCNSLKIVSGDGTNFYPTNKVTVAQAAKMLLTAIGYDAELSKYQNDSSWSINIMRDAKKAGIMANLASLKATDELTRDSAAQMIYNTLFADIVKPDVDRDQGVAYLKGYISQGTTLAEETYSMKSVTAKLMGTKAVPFASKKTLKDGEVAVAIKNTDGTYAAETVISIAASTALIGHEVKYFVNADGDVLSSALVATGKTVTSTASKDYAKFVTDNGLELAKGAATQISANYGPTKNYDGTGLTGTVIFVNTDGDKDNKIEFVITTNSTFGEVLDVNTTKATIKFSGIGTRNIKDVDGAADLVKGDFVIYTQTASTYSVKKAESVEGTMTSKTSTKISIDGTSYDFSGTDFTTDNGKNVTAMKKMTVKDAVAGTYYLDAAGKVTVFVPSEEVADTTAKYAYVEGISVKADEWTHDNTVTVKVILADGTRETKELTGADEAGTLANAAVEAKGNTDTLKGLTGPYAYTTKDDKLVIAKADKVDASANAIDFKTGAPSLKGDKKGPFADDSTVVLFYTPKTSTASEVLESHTGVKNIPNFKATTSTAFVALDKDGVYAKFIFVSGVPSGNVSDAQYAFSLNAHTDGVEVADGVSYSFVINGEKKDLTFSAALAAKDLAKNTIYTYTETDKGIATIVAAAAPVNGVVTSVTTDYVIVNDGTNNVTYYFTGDETIDDLTDFDSDGKLVPSAGTLAKGDTVKLFANGDNELAKAYIVPGKVNVDTVANGGAVLAATGTKSGTTYTVTATTNVSLDSCYTYKYEWTVDGSANDETGKSLITDGTSVKCVVSVISRLDGSVVGVAKDGTTAYTVTVDTFA